MRPIPIEVPNGWWIVTADTPEQESELNTQSRQLARDALRSIGRTPDERKTTRELFAEYKGTLPIPEPEPGNAGRIS